MCCPSPFEFSRTSQQLCDVSSTDKRRIRWANQALDLFAEHAVFSPKLKSLIIADPHFGKAAAFRARGVPVPVGTTKANLDRLSHLLLASGANRLIILGDLLHAHAGRADDTMAAVHRWRMDHAATEIVLVRGNHDKHAGDPPCEWKIHCEEEPFTDGRMLFCHHPECAYGTIRQSNQSVVAFAGHVHPCAVLHDRDGASMRAACFHFSQKVATLPAFGRFTGMHPIQPRFGDRIFAVGFGSVIEVRTRSR